MKKVLLILFCLLFSPFIVNPINAMSQETTTSVESQLSVFRQYRFLSPNFSVPTVVEVPFDDVNISNNSMAVIDTTSNDIIPSFTSLKTTSIIEPVHFSSSSDPLYKIYDSNLVTYESFPLPTGSIGTAWIEATSGKPFTSSSLAISLDTNVLLPKTIQISAQIDGHSTIVLAETSVNSSEVLFPKTKSNSWSIKLTYSQPMRITELKFNQSNTSTLTNYLRFLAQPNKKYKIYFDPEQSVSIPYKGELGNIALTTNVQTIRAVASLTNPTYKPVDADKDGANSTTDNCPSVYNPDQKDINMNGIGDICEDFDVDGIINSKDNCINLANSNQKDSDGDRIGDICDSLDSRITEQYKFLPWVGILFAAGVLGVLFWLTTKEGKRPGK